MRGCAGRQSGEKRLGKAVPAHPDIIRKIHGGDRGDDIDGDRVAVGVAADVAGAHPEIRRARERRGQQGGRGRTRDGIAGVALVALIPLEGRLGIAGRGDAKSRDRTARDRAATHPQGQGRNDDIVVDDGRSPGSASNEGLGDGVGEIGEGHNDRLVALGFGVATDGEIDRLSGGTPGGEGERASGESRVVRSGSGTAPGDGVVHREGRRGIAAGHGERENRRSTVALHRRVVRETHGADHTDAGRAQIGGRSDRGKGAKVCAARSGVAGARGARRRHPDERLRFGRAARRRTRMPSRGGGAILTGKAADSIAEEEQFILLGVKEGDSVILPQARRSDALKDLHRGRDTPPRAEIRRRGRREDHRLTGSDGRPRRKLVSLGRGSAATTVMPRIASDILRRRSDIRELPEVIRGDGLARRLVGLDLGQEERRVEHVAVVLDSEVERARRRPGRGSGDRGRLVAIGEIVVHRSDVEIDRGLAVRNRDGSRHRGFGRVARREGHQQRSRGRSGASHGTHGSRVRGALGKGRGSRADRQQDGSTTARDKATHAGRSDIRSIFRRREGTRVSGHRGTVATGGRAVDRIPDHRRRRGATCGSTRLTTGGCPSVRFREATRRIAEIRALSAPRVKESHRVAASQARSRSRADHLHRRCDRPPGPEGRCGETGEDDGFPGSDRGACGNRHGCSIGGIATVIIPPPAAEIYGLGSDVGQLPKIVFPGRSLTGLNLGDD